MDLWNGVLYKAYPEVFPTKIRKLLVKACFEGVFRAAIMAEGKGAKVFGSFKLKFSYLEQAKIRSS